VVPLKLIAGSAILALLLYSALLYFTLYTYLLYLTLSTLLYFTYFSSPYYLSLSIDGPIAPTFILINHTSLIAVLNNRI